MQLDSDPIGMYVFGGVVLAGTAVAVIVDLLRKNNDRLWEIATELKFRNDAADVKIKDLVRANAEVVAYANARAEVQAQATIPAPAPAAVEAPVAEQVAEEPLPGGRINLTPAPEKLQITVAAEVESAAAASLEVPRLDRPNRKPHREMTPAVAAVANLVEARLGGGAARHAAPAVEVEAKQPVVEVELPQEVLAVAETAQLDPGATLKIPIPVLAEDVIPVLAEAVAVDFVPAAVEASAVDEPAIAADILAGDFAPVAADGPVVVEMPAEAETAVVEPQPSLANTVGFGELVFAVAEAADSGFLEVALNPVDFELGVVVPWNEARLNPTLDAPPVEVEEVAEPVPAFASEVPLVFTFSWAEPATAAALLSEPLAAIAPELTAAAPFLDIPLIPTLVMFVPEAVEPEPAATQLVARKDWGKILGHAEQPAAYAQLFDRPAVSELPAGFHSVDVLRGAAEAGVEVTGMVLAIGVESSDPSGNSMVASFVQSLIQGRDFGCQTDTDEFVLICPPDTKPSSQRKLGSIAEKLWDFQLSSMGTLDVQFSWGGFEARKVTLVEAVNSALDQMRETRIERRMAQETRAAVS